MAAASALGATWIAVAAAGSSSDEFAGAETRQNPARAASNDDALRNRRDKERQAALKRHGGNRQTERAVADGLEWLANHQRLDGVWDRRGFDRLCPHNDRCSQTSLHRPSHDLDVGISALAALAFLGAGHTHEKGPYRDNLTRVFEFILAQQNAEGSFAAHTRGQIYDDALATLALAEAYAMTRDAVFARPLARAVRHLERSQQADGGWDYTADTRTRRSDTSITGWVLMAFKSALAAGIEPSWKTRLRMIEHFDRATERDGRVWYANRGTGTTRDAAGGEFGLRYGPAMTAVGLYARTALGFRVDDPPAVRQIRLLERDLPDLRRMYGDSTNLHGDYYWYYGTLAAFNVGGPTWGKWNAALRRTVMEYQERPTRKNGSKRHSFGSWPAFGRGWGKWGKAGSRIYSTAINTLTLEIYYRYEPAHLSPRGLIGAIELRREMADAGPGREAELLELVKRLHGDTAEPLLLEFLTSRRRAVRLDAAIALARLGSPKARDELLRQRESGPAQNAAAVNKALRTLEQAPVAAGYGAVTEVDAKAGMFLFDTQGRPVYYGQRVHVLRGGRRVATAVVNRRFTAHRAAAARIEGGSADVAVGDKVTARTPDDGDATQG